jgi:hypothetical protein
MESGGSHFYANFHRTNLFHKSTSSCHLQQMASPGHSVVNKEELANSDSPTESSTLGQNQSESPRIESLRQILVQNTDRQSIDSALLSAQSFLQEISRAFDCLRRHYIDSFLPTRTPRKLSMSPRASNSFSAEALVLLCEDFELCPHPFPPSYICKVYSGLTNLSDSPVDLLARSLTVLACAGFRQSGIPGKLLSEAEAFVALLQHMHFSRGPSRLHSALGLGTAPRPMFRVASPSYDGKNEKSYFVECLPMLLAHSSNVSHQNAAFHQGALENSSSGIAGRGLVKANQIAAANRLSRFIKLYREENNIELTGAPVLTQKSSDFERGVHDLFEFNRNKEMKVALLRQKQQQAELMKFDYTPRICAKSDTIAGELHRVGTVEDRLLAEGRLSEAKVAAARMMQSRAVLVHAKPRSSSAPVKSRIASVPSETKSYDDQVVAANKTDTPLSSASKRDTNQKAGQKSPDFKPSINPVSKRLHRSVRVEYALNAWGEARNAKWDAIRAQEEFKATQLASRPGSASASGHRRPATVDVATAHHNGQAKISSWRLHSPENVVASQNVKSRTEKVVQDLKLTAPSFQPSVDKMSRKLDAQRHQHSEKSSHRSRFSHFHLLHESLTTLIVGRLFF